ncbi:substrate-binding domain-containing protein [Spirochaeta isovalerica]|uniref:D-xylose transport system substrate-binding protein n=1 Tax=Spirochaeta isovalerica TaxID=150 RepID=A0A841RCS8_9SPIO|nr:D-xylose transport system substrate-binding protein [Spirochaeta isovalerica]
MIIQRVFTVVLLSIFLLPSCKVKKPDDDQPIRIGFSAASETFLLERWDRDIKIFMNTARELGADVIFAKSPGNALDQIPQIQYLLGQDIDVLVVIPQDKALLSGVIQKTLDRGIPVLAYDRPIMDVPITGYVSFDNNEVGRLLASSLVSRVPEGNYLIVNGSIHDNNSYQVNNGVHEILDPLVLKGDIRIAREIWLEQWSYDEALVEIGKFLDQTEDVQAVSAANDLIAQAAVRLLLERQLAGKVQVVGQDADLVSCQSIVEGKQLMTVYKPIQNLAARAAKLAVAMAERNMPEPDRFIDNNSSKEIPYFVEKPIPVFKDDMDSTVIADGFHSREDVYRTP